MHIGLIGGIGVAATDLGLAFDGVETGYPVIDALDVHVGVLADLALGRRGVGGGMAVVAALAAHGEREWCSSEGELHPTLAQSLFSVK